MHKMQDPYFFCEVVADPIIWTDVWSLGVLRTPSHREVSLSTSRVGSPKELSWVRSQSVTIKYARMKGDKRTTSLVESFNINSVLKSMGRNRPFERNVQARKLLWSLNSPACQSALAYSLTWLEQDAKEVRNLVPKWSLLCSTAPDSPTSIICVCLTQYLINMCIQIWTGENPNHLSYLGRASSNINRKGNTFTDTKLMRMQRGMLVRAWNDTRVPFCFYSSLHLWIVDRKCAPLTKKKKKPKTTDTKKTCGIHCSWFLLFGSVLCVCFLN